MLPIFSRFTPGKLHALEKTKNNNLNHMITSIQAHISLHHLIWLFITILVEIFILIFICHVPLQVISIHHHQQQREQNGVISHAGQQCKNGMVYVYELPGIFNRELLENCNNLDPWNSRCNALSNNGYGPRATGLARVVPDNLAPAWYWTDMFAGEVIYHTKILNYKCRTLEPNLATAFYIPFYAGLAIEKYLFTNYSATERDLQGEMLLRWVQDQPYYKIFNGSDHFIMLGRMTWDFRRMKDGDWGSSFINMPGMKHITRLSVERNPWDHLEVSVPYPTGLHPLSGSDIAQWQRFVRDRNRTSLYTFVGGKRKMKNDFRALLLDRCHDESNSCRAVDCSGKKCYDGTSAILEAFLDSDFCLQPRGDAYTRKSMFDCMLAGSIPVFFWKRSIHNQYEWFLNDEPESFSVFIDRNDVSNRTSIRRVLESYSRKDVKRMRGKVIDLIPRFVYAMANDDLESSKDAFDIAMEGVLRKFKEQKRTRNKFVQKE